MRALQITDLSGPDAVRAVDVAEPEASHPFTPGQGVLIDVRAAAVSFPDLLQTRDLYHPSPSCPSSPGPRWPER